MLSKPSLFGDLPWEGSQSSAFGSMASELLVAASQVLPAGCGIRRNRSVRPFQGNKHVQGHRADQSCSIIETTVSESRLQEALHREASKAATKILNAAEVLVDSAEIEPTEQLEKDRSRARWMQAAKEASLLVGLQAPLALLSPWSSLGVTAAAVPPMPMPASMLPPGLQEEEPFAALIFPGFDSGAFIWQITCWQVAEFAFSMWLGHNRANPTPCVLYQLGASWGPALARGQIWRLVTPVMLHANLTHLLFNVFFQLRMGFGMERQFGREKMMMIYFACGLFGNLMSVAVDPYKLAVGASTAGFGLIGVWLAEILLSWEILGPARERTVIWIVFMMISVTTMSSMTPNMDIFGHLGGALGGFLLALVISDMKETDRPEWYHQVRAAAALALLLCLSGGLIKAFEINPKDPIPDCQIFKSLSHVMDAAAKTMSAHVTAVQ